MRKLVLLAIPAVLVLSACGADPYNTGDCTTTVHHHVTHHVITPRKPARPRVSLGKTFRRR